MAGKMNERLASGVSRRSFMAASAALSAGLVGLESRASGSAPPVRVAGLELLPVRATERTVWLLVRLRTNVGLTGLGEASDAFGYANTTRQDNVNRATRQRTPASASLPTHF